MKPILKSKTFWLAVLQIAVAVIAILITQYPEIQTVGAFLIVKSAIDIVLRALTTQPVV